MKVLVACEESQTVCKAFRERGHEAYSCDIQEPSGGHPEWHILGDAIAALDGGVITTMDVKQHDVGKWDLLIAHPPCTYLTAAGACRMYPTKGNIDMSRYQKAQEAKEFFMMFYNAHCDKIVIENPKPLKVVDLPKETQRVQPWEYAKDESEFFTKQTYLWEKGVDLLVPLRTEKPIETIPFVNAGSKKANGEYRDKQGIKHTAIERSKTFFGIAAAMAEQWGGVDG